jgi:quinol monooxygenase YgiN
MPNTPLTIVAKIIAKEGKSALVKTELLKLVEPTKAEEGCINYDLHQDNTNANVFLFFENWSSRALWLKHMDSPHIDAYAKATEGHVAAFTLHEMSFLDQ